MNEATTLGAAILTAAVGLYQELQLPMPPAPSSDIPILIWSGASISLTYFPLIKTSVGMLAIQVATLSGLQVITTASPRNHDLLKSFGAQHLLDYRSPTVVEDIFRLTGCRLEYIYDCISE
jgi:NADPH:quinone reductase-like Zn-dependent oxidoreductase